MKIIAPLSVPGKGLKGPIFSDFMGFSRIFVKNIGLAPPVEVRAALYGKSWILPASCHSVRPTLGKKSSTTEGSLSD